MLFAEEMNAYFGGTSHGNHTNSSAANSMEMPVPWKPPGAHASEIGYSDGSGSKLVTKWGGHHPMAVGDYGPKNGHQEQPVMGHPFTPNFAGGHGGFAWNEPTFQFPPQQQQDQANVFHPSMTPQQTGPGHFTPPVEIVNGQWGRAEINQTTPWNMEMNGGMPDQNNQQQQYQRNRKWDQQQREENAQFNAGGYGTPTTPYGMPGYNNERMMPGGNFPTQFGGPNSRAPPQRWDGMGHAGGKFGAAAEMAPAGPNSQQRGGGGPLFSGPPPPLHSMGMMPPRPNHIMGHMPPPPLLPSLNPHGGMGQFNVNTFAPTGPNIQTASISDDSVWQDPNGELRKWQRDTGTSIWGDPMKQANILIQRWQQFTADEVVAKSSILKEGEIVEGGWGDLPPIGSNANNSNNGNSNNVNNSAGNGNGGSQQPFMTSQSQHNQQQHPHKSQQQRVQSAVGNTGSAWGQDNQLNGANWERIEQQQQQQNAPVHAGQFFVNQSTASGGVAAQQGNFVLPPSTSSNAQQQQQSMFQPPSLLSSIIDSGTNEAAGEQQQQQHGGQPQRKATSPNGSSQQQASKVSLAEELSSLGGTHSLGGGQIW